MAKKYIHKQISLGVLALFIFGMGLAIIDMETKPFMEMMAGILFMLSGISITMAIGLET